MANLLRSFPKIRRNIERVDERADEINARIRRRFDAQSEPLDQLRRAALIEACAIRIGFKAAKLLIDTAKAENANTEDVFEYAGQLSVMVVEVLKGAIRQAEEVSDVR